jgi:hypothetical protein
LGWGLNFERRKLWTYITVPNNVRRMSAQVPASEPLIHTYEVPRVDVYDKETIMVLMLIYTYDFNIILNSLCEGS